VRIKRVYRFQCAQTGIFHISGANLNGIAGGTVITTNSVVSLWSNCFKVHKVEMWAPGVTGSSTITLDWQTAIGSVQSNQVSDTTLSAAYPAHIVSKPPVGSSAALQNYSGTGVIMDIACPLDTIIDITISHWAIDSGQLSYQRTITTGIAGTQYWFALDSSNLLVPVGLTFTT
jgi:hypothetical protein